MSDSPTCCASWAGKLFNKATAPAHCPANMKCSTRICCTQEGTHAQCPLAWSCCMTDCLRQSQGNASHQGMPISTQQLFNQPYIDKHPLVSLRYSAEVSILMPRYILSNITSSRAFAAPCFDVATHTADAACPLPYQVNIC